MRSSQAVKLALLAAVAVIPLFAGGALAAAAHFDGLYGQDAFAYFDYAVGPLRASLLRLEPLPPFFWPPGYPLLVALASLIVGPLPIAGQVVSLLSAALVPLFTGLLAKNVCDRSGDRSTPFVPVCAAVMAALTPQLWQSGMVHMSDTSALASATIGVWALTAYGESGKRWPWLMLASGCLAWAILTRWAYALVAIPCAVYALAVLRRRNAWRDGIAAVIVAAAILAPLLGSSLVQLFVGHDSAAPFAGDLRAYSWSPLNALHNEFTTTDGRLRYRFANGLYYALAPARQYFFTPLLAAFIAPGLYAVARRRTSAAMLLVVAWAGIVYVFHAGAPWQNFRFTLAYLPPLAILVTAGIREALRLGGRTRLLVGSVVITGLLWMVVSGVSLCQGFVERKNADLAVVRWVEMQTPGDARLLTFNLTLTFRHYSRLKTLELFELDEEELSALLAEESPTYLLVNVANVEEQWQNMSPGVNYRWLRDEAGLRSLGQRQVYTLFRVGGMP